MICDRIMKRNRRRQFIAPSAFTLVELLIVIAIIALLAAIAVPNFLEAQTRSRIARVNSDMRLLAMALEAYRVDGNHYPPGPIPNGQPGRSVQTWRLTTPVAYITEVPIDIFLQPPGVDFMGGPFGLGGIYLHYLNGENEPRLEEVWLAFSYGPDADMEQDAVCYDPTNGTISNGDIYRTGADTQNSQTPVGDP